MSVVKVGDQGNFACYMFGGIINERFISNKLYRLQQSTEKKLKEPMAFLEFEEIILQQKDYLELPFPRFDHEMVSGRDGDMYMFGGVVSPFGHRCNLLWKLSMQDKKLVWSKVHCQGTIEIKIEDDCKMRKIPVNEGCTPSGRSNHSMTYDLKENMLLLFGGSQSRTIDGDLNDLWQFDLNSSEWTQVFKNQWSTDPEKVLTLRDAIKMSSVVTKFRKATGKVSSNNL